MQRTFDKEKFSGTICFQGPNGVELQMSSGLANRSEKRGNDDQTRFAIASGCKVFTAVAICQLIEEGRLNFDTPLHTLLGHEFPQFDNRVNIHHLLTHSSGIPDYFDEAETDNFEDLWVEIPVYGLREVRDFLPLFQNKPMSFAPGHHFHYNNAGYIVLGLVVESITERSFQEYIEENIFKLCDMNDSGYFSMDQLPENTSYGYIKGEDGRWRSNIYSVPVKGGADGGAYVTAPDMVRFWEALMNEKILSVSMKRELLTPRIQVKEGIFYGYGLWMNIEDDQVYKYHVMGYDPGVSFHSSFYPETRSSLVVLSNHSSGAFEIMKAMENQLICRRSKTAE
ncbi:serine hydrolase [Halobacillus sp. BBL2006]|uniref:serine hydrolase domain-containing protein n=1 Tax=Halobacillus sp. BBL2006 TaxID=1543706 RepID=UPI000541B3DD|nr:penicillin-binding protein [Halobacillus sp. BBL2006]